METKDLIITNKRLNAFAHNVVNRTCSLGEYIAALETQISDEKQLHYLEQMKKQIKELNGEIDLLYREINPTCL